MNETVSQSLGLLLYLALIVYLARTSLKAKKNK